MRLPALYPPSGEGSRAVSLMRPLGYSSRAGVATSSSERRSIYFRGGGVRLKVRFCTFQPSPSLTSIAVQKPSTGPCGDVRFHDPDDHLTVPSLSHFVATITKSCFHPSLIPSSRRSLTAAGPTRIPRRHLDSVRRVKSGHGARIALVESVLPSAVDCALHFSGGGRNRSGNCKEAEGRKQACAQFH